MLNQSGSLASTSLLGPLLELSVDYFKRSGGYFDPSFARLQQAYGFYSDAGRLPGEEEVTRLLHDNCGLDRVFRREDNDFTLASGSLLDLGGIAGGYAIEKAAHVLRTANCTGFLIDDAGDIWFEGKKPDNSPWRIAVRDPRDNGTLALIESKNPLAISTSGDYERFIIVEGNRYGHIMNPYTGRPVDYYSSVTIIASEPVAADALSTAVFAMPPEIAFKWVEERNLAALFLTSTGTIHLSSAGRNYFSQVKLQ
jgi:thiamine biosynthesis lipoprotein